MPDTYQMFDESGDYQCTSKDKNFALANSHSQLKYAEGETVPDVDGKHLVGGVLVAIHTDEELATQATEVRTAKFGNDIVSAINERCKSKDYYYGLGFVNGIDSASNHPEHADSKLLTIWSDTVWERVSKIKTDIFTHTAITAFKQWANDEFSVDVDGQLAIKDAREDLLVKFLDKVKQEDI